MNESTTVVQDLQELGLQEIAQEWEAAVVPQMFLVIGGMNSEREEESSFQPSSTS